MAAQTAASAGQRPEPGPALVPLGRTDVRVGPVGVGSMTWGDVWGGIYGGGYRADDAAAALQACLGARYTLVDTAEPYSFGRAERVLGRGRRAREDWPA
jgi:aryl-alcohol dehydrogenase-like predicted oxidoreductase